MPCASHVSVLFQKCVLPQRRIRSVAEFRQRFPEVKDVMIDGVGRPIQRPQSSKQQNRHYSGKKKSHQRKKVVMTDARRRVLVLMPSMPGRRHENLVDSSQASIPGEVGVIVDTGFQGVKVPPNLFIPHKTTKKRPVNPEDRTSNRYISSQRMVVAHFIGGMKRYGAMHLCCATSSVDLMTDWPWSARACGITTWPRGPATHLEGRC
jgi:hypothetical protein